MSFGINGTVFLPPKPLKQGKLVEKTCEFVKVGLYRAHVSLVKAGAVKIIINNRDLVCLEGINTGHLETDFRKIIPPWMTLFFGLDDISTLYEKVREVLFEYYDTR